MSAPILAELTGSTAMVTGGAGFIGSHLVSSLVRAGAKRVIALDNLAYSKWTNLRISENDAVDCVETDLVDLSSDDLVTRLEGCDVLFHFAAEKHNNAVDSPQRVIDVNVSATARLFDAAGRAGVRKVVFASSLYVYGRGGRRPMSETDMALPSTIYGVSKLTGEGLLREAATRDGFGHVCLRLFFVYGPRQFAGTGYPSVIVRNFLRILRGEEPVIFGDGEQVLDYLHVDDVVGAVLRAAQSQASDEVINIGTGRPVSINLLTETMLRVAQSSLRPKPGPADWTAGTWRVSNPAKAKELLGWEPEVGLDEGLRQVWLWMQESRKQHWMLS